jgi:hypothetical protein
MGATCSSAVLWQMQHHFHLSRTEVRRWGLSLSAYRLQTEARSTPIPEANVERFAAHLCMSCRFFLQTTLDIDLSATQNGDLTGR